MTPIKKKRREDILNAAMIVFTNDGFHKGTVENIAIEAGIGKGTVYEYFNSKQEIFEQMILSILNSYVDSAKKAIKYESSTKDKLVALLDFDFKFINEHSNIIEKSMYSLEDISDNFKPSIIKLHQGIFDFVVDLIKEGQENGEINDSHDENILALIWLNVVMGINKNKNLFKHNIQIDHDVLIDIIFNGIA